MKLTEDSIEQNLIDLLQQQGYAYFNDTYFINGSINVSMGSDSIGFYSFPRRVWGKSYDEV